MDIISSIIAATISVIIFIVFFQMNIKLSSIKEELKQLRMSILERDREHAKVAYLLV
jgi:cell division protein FtsL